MNTYDQIIMPCGFCCHEWFWHIYSKKYRKKPIEIEAIQLECDATVKTLEGNMVGRSGDWLVRGIEGEFYIVKNSIFKKTYEEVK